VTDIATNSQNYVQRLQQHSAVCLINYAAML